MGEMMIDDDVGERRLRRRRPRGNTPLEYGTRLDAFRASERLELIDWAREAGIARQQLWKYRAGRMEPGFDRLAVLVRAASRLLHRPVAASELYDLGEETPVGVWRPEALPSQFLTYKYDSSFDALLRRLDISPKAFATEAGLSRQTLRLIRAHKSVPGVFTIWQIVSAFRRLGYDVKAADILDVGEGA